MLNKKSSALEREEIIPLIEKLESIRTLIIEDALTKKQSPITKVRLLGDRVIFEFEGGKCGQTCNCKSEKTS